MEFGKGSWKVVGVFDAGGSAYESEVWGDVNQMAADFDRTGGFYSAHFDATVPTAAHALEKLVGHDQVLKLEGVLDRAYYRNQAGAGGAHQIHGPAVGTEMDI